MADLKKRRTSLVKSLLGHDAPPQKLVLRGMANFEKALAQRFQQQNKQRARLATDNALLRDKLLGLFGEDPKWAAHMRRKWQAGRKSPPSRRIQLRKGPRAKDHISLGSLGGTRTTPFDYQWSWKAITGPAGLYHNTITADASIGDMDMGPDSFPEGPEGDQPGSVSARAAVGIFFSSPSECLRTLAFGPLPASVLPGTNSALRLCTFRWLHWTLRRQL